MDPHRRPSTPLPRSPPHPSTGQRTRSSDARHSRSCGSFAPIRPPTSHRTWNPVILGAVSPGESSPGPSRPTPWPFPPPANWPRSLPSAGQESDLPLKTAQMRARRPVTRASPSKRPALPEQLMGGVKPTNLAKVGLTLSDS
ncbi:hypothetical protein N7535_003468 [Penicillium sp. DV-2018c]|nr:hypothetical protein N7461_000826 [Penicillium sp. DV-2018c]KAJ5562075.1 hypothetical protein N7461_000836 [Penicillium sp. DV-2018c]KAJ5562085.1 hypothetical protein N7461_000846 [Penicillium sp. DV-2018c]KAJ5562090.1 hypothetical protein N7461_000851 [Penicillium sp. DV-2018c]KAJ5576542.1 hypothetical protein N7535_003468 [Penicillium sp. DV-2018c]